MNAKRVKAAEGVILAAQKQGRSLAASLAYALESACLLQSPESAMELELLQRELAAARAELEELRALKPAPIQTCRTCGAGYTYGQPCSQCTYTALLAEVAADEGDEDDGPTDVIDVPDGWRDTPVARRAVEQLRADHSRWEDPHTSELHRDHTEPRDLPARADTPESLR